MNSQISKCRHFHIFALDSLIQFISSPFFHFHLEYYEVNHFSLGIERKDISSHIASYDPLYATFEWQSGEKKKSLFSYAAFLLYFLISFLHLILVISSVSFFLTAWLCLLRPIVYTKLKVSSSIYWMNEVRLRKAFKATVRYICGITMETKRNTKKEMKGGTVTFIRKHDISDFSKFNLLCYCWHFPQPSSLSSSLLNNFIFIIISFSLS